MPDATVSAVDPPPGTADHDSGLPIPPIDAAFFSQQFADEDCGGQTDVLDFDFSFDDMWIPDDLDEILNSNGEGFDSQPLTDSDSHQFAPIIGPGSLDLPQFSGDGGLFGDHSREDFVALNSASPGLESDQIPAYLNVASPESNGSNQEMSENCDGGAKVKNCPSTESRGSENWGSNVSEEYDDLATRSVTSSPNSNNSSIRPGIVDQKIKLDEQSRSKANSSSLKRKKDCEDLVSNNVESRTIKCKKSSCISENNGNKNNNNNNDVGLFEEDEKRKVRLIRNRESAQLSRQRKKQYVEELENKMKTMHSTIQDLNAKISYFMAENATLRQQMGGPGAIPPPPGAVPPPGMYPYPGMTYPWMPYGPPYMMKPQGSQVPLVPIPRLKPQQPGQAPKMSKKVESKNKKNVETKTKKVASISFIGLLFFILLFGGLVPMINMRYGGVRESMTGVESYTGGGFYEKHHGRILTVNGTASGSTRCSGGKTSGHCDERSHHSGGKSSDDEFVRAGNGSEPLLASLYVPRNDKLVRIDGNLVIHSVLASEKAMSSRDKGGETGTGTDLAVHGAFSGDIPVPGVGRIGSGHPHLKALGSGLADTDNGRLKATDGRLQQWFREGLAGPMLSSGMCTEVLQFEVSPSSPSGAIVPSTTPRNILKEQNNSTHLSKGRKNRRVLGNLPIPLPDSLHNITRQHSERNSQKENLAGNSSSPMVVSILVDPREAADADVDGVMGKTKFISRIFVVVLIDSVKYVTYSCMLPFKGAAHHLVTA